MSGLAQARPGGGTACMEPVGAPVPSWIGAQALASRLVLAGLSLSLVVSGNMLDRAGLAYSTEGGLVLAKIHPASYLMYAALAAGMLSWSPGAGPLAGGLLRAGKAAGRDAALFIAAMAVACGMTLLENGSGAAVILLDSFLPAGCAALVLSSAPAPLLLRFTRVFKSLVLLNAVIAIAEICLRQHVMPSPEADFDARTQFRAMALYDHPLTGSAVTMLALLLPASARDGVLAPARRLRGALAAARPQGEPASLARADDAAPILDRRGAAYPWIGRTAGAACRRATGAMLAAAAYWLILLLGLLAFGGRVALAVAMLAAGARLRRLRGAGRAWLIIAIAAGVIGVAGLALAAGLGQRVQDDFYWDGSAQVRIDEFQVLGALEWSDFLFGCARAQMIGLTEALRLQSNVGVIENFWLLLLVLLGVPGFAVFCAGMAALGRWCWRIGGQTGGARGQAGARSHGGRGGVGPGGTWPGATGLVMFGAFLLVTSTSNSLGRKSILLPLLVGCVSMAGAVRRVDAP